jgi:hypothetical protein
MEITSLLAHLVQARLKTSVNALPGSHRVWQLVGVCLLAAWLVSSVAAVFGESIDSVDDGLSNRPETTTGFTPDAGALLLANDPAGAADIAEDSLDSGQELIDEVPDGHLRASLVFASLMPLNAGERVNVTQLLVMQEDFSGSLDIFPVIDIQAGVRLQNTDIEQANFVSAKSTVMGITIETDVELQIDLLADDQQAMPVFRLNNVSLYRGDQIEVSYRNLQLSGDTEQALQLPLRLRLASLDRTLPGEDDFTDPDLPVAPPTPDRVWQTLEGESRQINPGEAVQVNVVVPQIVKTAEPFQASIELLDRYGNAAKGPLPSFDILLDGSFVDRADSTGSDGNTIQVPEQIVTTAGLHTISVRSTGGGLRGLSPLILAEDNPDFELYWTDFSSLSLAALPQDKTGQPENALINTEVVDPLWITAIDTRTDPMLDQQLNYRGIRAGGSWLELTRATTQASVLLAELTGDRRRASTSLIQLLAGPSGHEWLLEHYAQLGSTFGITATRASLQARWQNPGPATGILAKPGETWLQALAQGRTYVTNGTKAIVLWDLNGTSPGARAGDSQQRLMNLDIFSEVPVVQVDWLKNGQVLGSTLSEPLQESGNAQDKNRVGTLPATRTLWLNIGLFSSARPVRPGLSLPRNAREWLGYIKLTGLKLMTIAAPAFDKVSDSAIAINPDDPNRVDFLGWSHGNWVSFRAKVEIPVGAQQRAANSNEIPIQSVASPVVDQTAGTANDRLATTRDESDLLALELHIREGFEDVLFLPGIREPSTTPGLEELVTLNSLQVEPFRRDLIANGYRDKVVIRIEPELKSQEYSFTYKDTLNLLPGDYYHARIRLQNGDFIWTSPTFVGGFDSVFHER